MTKVAPPPPSPTQRRIAALERRQADTLSRVAALYRHVTWLQEIGCVTMLTVLALLAFGIFVWVRYG